jgi:hypothetical protein
LAAGLAPRHRSSSAFIAMLRFGNHAGIATFSAAARPSVARIPQAISAGGQQRGFADRTGAGRGRGRVSLGDRLQAPPAPVREHQRPRRGAQQEGGAAAGRQQQQQKRQQQQQPPKQRRRDSGDGSSGAATPAWAADAQEEEIGDIKDLMWGQSGAPRGTAARTVAPPAPPPPKQMSPEELERRSQRMAAAVSAAAPMDAKGWSPVAALDMQFLAVAEEGDAQRGAKLTFEEFEAKYANRTVWREPVARNLEAMGELMDLELMGKQYTFDGNPRPGNRFRKKKTFQMSRGQVMVTDVQAELFGVQAAEQHVQLEQEEHAKLVAEQAVARQDRMAVPMHRQAGFSSLAAAVTAVQKNTSLQMHGQADGMVQELAGRELAFMQTVEELETYVREHKERLAAAAAAAPVVEDAVEELAYGELLEDDDFDEDDEEFL